MRAIRVLAALAVVFVSRSAAAEPTVTAGVGVSGLQVGTAPALAVTPHAGVAFARDGWTVALRDSLSLVPGSHGLGANNVIALAGGYRWPSLTATLGVTVAQYVLPVCSPVLCARVMGIAPGVDGAVAAHDKLAVPSGGTSTNGARVVGGWAFGSREG